MKSWSKVVALFLCSVLLFSIVGCDSNKSLKVIDSGDFEDVLEDLDYDVTVYDDSDYLDKGVEEEASVTTEDLYVTFTQYEDEEDAVDEFNDMYDGFKDAKDDEDFEGTLSKTTGKNYQKCVVNGDFDGSKDFGDSSTYWVAFQIENTLVLVVARDNGKSEVKDVNEVVKELGY